MAVKTPESVGHSRRWYFTLAAIAAGGQATALVVLSVLQFARFEHAEGRRYVPDALDQFVRTLSAPLLLFYPPEWVFWLRTYGVDERWLVPLFVAMNALLWGVARLERFVRRPQTATSHREFWDERRLDE